MSTPRTLDSFRTRGFRFDSQARTELFTAVFPRLDGVMVHTRLSPAWTLCPEQGFGAEEGLEELRKA